MSFCLMLRRETIDLHQILFLVFFRTGELLTHQSCECLEEILKGLQFEIIDLQETKLDENGASALLDMILYYESATYLNISSNQNIGGLGWLALSQLIQKSSCLVGLDASNMPLLECPARTLSRALQFSRLTVLHLENCYLTGRPLFTLISLNPALQELYLAGNGLNGSQDSMQLGDLVKYNCSLKLLDLRDNHISDTGTVYKYDSIKNDGNICKLTATVSCCLTFNLMN
uniref:Protein phosphatase 1 regulatory subunit 37 n=1 Tax=Erpetoichthys calabaricus TaxID=27687 RepID=A0A8C4T881_ERPCA